MTRTFSIQTIVLCTIWVVVLAIAASTQVNAGIIATCGDGLIEDLEECDDGNLVDGDGCSALCSIECQTDADCDNDLFCDGAEICDVGTGECLAGTLVDINDGVACTVDSCDEIADVVVNILDDGLCDNGLFCDGSETCDALLDCQPGLDPCNPATESCDEGADICQPIPQCDPNPLTQGYWHRQCLGVPANEGGLDPGGKGRGPQSPTEPNFVEELMGCAEGVLGGLGFGETTCEGMEADPPSDDCERALKQLTALILNVCSDRLQLDCPVCLDSVGTFSPNVSLLISDVASYIQAGMCKAAAQLAALANEGEAICVIDD